MNYKNISIFIGSAIDSVLCQLLERVRQCNVGNMDREEIDHKLNRLGWPTSKTETRYGTEDSTHMLLPRVYLRQRFSPQLEDSR